MGCDRFTQVSNVNSHALLPQDCQDKSYSDFKIDDDMDSGFDYESDEADGSGAISPLLIGCDRFSPSS